jgi:organic radical activating enzyme
MIAVDMVEAPSAHAANCEVDARLYAEVLGVKVRRRTGVCHPDVPLLDSFNLTVHVTDACPCSCNFCCNSSKGLLLDVDQFKRDYEVMRTQCTIGHVYFTGGEPTLYWDKIKECLGFIDVEATIHTMGFNLKQIDVPVNVSLSRHHWDHAINEKILGVKLPLDYLDDFPMKKRTNLACNIIKGYVDNATDMAKVLDLSIEHEFPLVSFIGLMPINGYSREHGLRIPTLPSDDAIKYRQFSFQHSCSCSNFCYHKDGKFQQYYIRHNTCPDNNRGGRIVYKNGVQPWFN